MLDAHGQLYAIYNLFSNIRSKGATLAQATGRSITGIRWDWSQVLFTQQDTKDHISV